MKYLYLFFFLMILFFLKTNSISNPLLSSVLPQANLFLGNAFDSPDYTFNENETIEELERKEAESERGKLFSILREFIESLDILNNQTNITEQCKNVINRYLFGRVDPNNSSYISHIISDFHIIKLLDDSSKNRNNLGTYENCMSKYYKMKKNYEQVFSEYNIYNYDLNSSTLSNYVALVVDRNNTNETTDEDDILNLDFNFVIIAFCLPQGYNEEKEYCTDDDYLKLLKSANDKLDNILRLNDTSLTIFSLRNNTIKGKESSTDFFIFLKMLPFIFFVLQALITILRSVIIKIINCCDERKLKKNKENEKTKEENEDDEDEYDNGRISDVGKNLITNKEKENKHKILYEILDCFSWEENFKELFSFSINSTKYNNDSGLNFIRGLMGLSMLFVSIGSTFVVLYNSPIKESSPNHIIEFFLDNYIFAIMVMIGIRYSPRVILSCSGYLLAYKYICYLNKNANKAFCPLIKSGLKFISYQFHKYFLFIMLLLFERFSAYDLFVFYNRKESPAFKYLNEFILNEPPFSRFILSFLLWGNITYNPDEQFRRGNNLLHYLWLPFTEILFFLIGIIFITLGFKTKWRIDIVILILVPAIYLAKLIYFYLETSIYEEHKELPLNKSYSTLYYVFFNYGRDMINPLFNIPYYLIGIYFGFINYTIQRGITRLNKTDNVKLFLSKEEKDEEEEEDNENNSSIDNKLTNDIKEELKEKSNDNTPKEDYCEEIKEMPFLITPIKFVQWHRKKTKRLIYIICFIFILIFFFFCYAILLFSITFSKDEEIMEKKMRQAFTNDFIDFLYRIDIELVIFFVLWSSFIIMIHMNDLAFEFFNNIFWIVLSRPYFSFTLTINTFLMFLFYHEETLNEVNSISVLMFSLIGGGGTFLFMSFFYILYELPLKRLIRVCYGICDDSNEKDEEDKNDKINNEDFGNDDNSSDKEDKIKIE